MVLLGKGFGIIIGMKRALSIALFALLSAAVVFAQTPPSYLGKKQPPTTSTAGQTNKDETGPAGPVVTTLPRITPYLERLAKTSPDQTIDVIVTVDPSQRTAVLDLVKSLGGKLSTNDPQYNSPDLSLFITIKAGSLLNLVQSSYEVSISEPTYQYSLGGSHRGYAAGVIVTAVLLAAILILAVYALAKRRGATLT